MSKKSSDKWKAALTARNEQAHKNAHKITDEIINSTVNSESAKANLFRNDDKYKMVFPSLMTAEQEEDLNIIMNSKLGNLSLRDSIKVIKRYAIIEDFLRVYEELTKTDIYFLKFIAGFKSVQQIHLLRQVSLYPEKLGDNETLNMVLYRLIRFGLIERWVFEHPVAEENVNVFTLSGNGHRFLKVIYSVDFYYHPNNYFLKGHKRDHLRFWETVDIYQSLVSLPSFRQASTWFNGTKEKPIKGSPLQVAMDMGPKAGIYRYIFYPALQNDTDKFYKQVITQWNDFVEDGAKMDKPINFLEGNKNILTFYSPTYKTALGYIKDLELSEFEYPILFMVGQAVQKNGLGHAFVAPKRHPKKDSEQPGDWMEFADLSAIIRN